MSFSSAVKKTWNKAVKRTAGTAAASSSSSSAPPPGEDNPTLPSYSSPSGYSPPPIIVLPGSPFQSRHQLPVTPLDLSIETTDNPPFGYAEDNQFWNPSYYSALDDPILENPSSVATQLDFSHLQPSSSSYFSPRYYGGGQEEYDVGSTVLPSLSVPSSLSSEGGVGGRRQFTLPIGGVQMATTPNRAGPRKSRSRLASSSASTSLSESTRSISPPPMPVLKEPLPDRRSSSLPLSLFSSPAYSAGGGSGMRSSSTTFTGSGNFPPQTASLMEENPVITIIIDGVERYVSYKSLRGMMRSWTEVTEAQYLETLNNLLNPGSESFDATRIYSVMKLGDKYYVRRKRDASQYLNQKSQVIRQLSVPPKNRSGSITSPKAKRKPKPSSSRKSKE